MKQKLNMPTTKFTQRSNSGSREKELLDLWLDVFSESNKMNSKEKSFKLHDGPPYANGDVHVGHVMNKVLKDMVVKYKLMSGYNVDFRPGSDCHGLPTELLVQKLNPDLDTSDLRNKCAEWALNYSNRQNDVFKSFGVFGNWDNRYLTMSPEYELKQLEALYRLLDSDLLYNESRPVYYSPSSKTVLAESELEYKMVDSYSLYFTFNLEDNRKMLLWTTQPWTLLGNKAVCVNPNNWYLDVLYKDQVYVVSESSLKLFNDYKVLGRYQGSKLKDLKYSNLFDYGVVLCDNFVKSDSGTGLVHLCPQHGDDDFNVCSRFNLSGDDLTDDDGLLKNGLFCLTEGSEYVLSLMSDSVFKLEKFEHSYPHDWRTGKPVYFKMMDQFFLNLKDLKSKSLLELDMVKFFDTKSRNRLKSTVESRDRWCLSRQRKWGFPLAFFLKDGKPYLNNELKDHVFELFRLFGSNVWFDRSSEDLLPNNYKNKGLNKCEYTVDVWFDSGLSWYSVMGGQFDLCLEGNDQTRGWFQSSLLTSVALQGLSPYKSLVSHGFVLDEDGKKMSKSLGNVVYPKDVQSKYNSDVFRLWVSVVNYTEDVQLGDSVLKSCGEYYFKFRNTLRYLLGNLYGFKFEDVDLKDKELEALSKCDDMYNKVLSYYSDLNFRKVFEELMLWVSNFSSQYLDLQTKSYLYEYDLESVDRQRCQYVLNYCFLKFNKLLAPLCSFLSEDAYQHYEFKKYKSVFMERY